MKGICKKEMKGICKKETNTFQPHGKGFTNNSAFGSLSMSLTIALDTSLFLAA